ncbi:MAG: PGF-pre-PGF domain-containing protein, partial [Methanosarcina sp.]|nr:PGF-pre-PGF domain-containing protein [Methanosarcina sp.]
VTYNNYLGFYECSLCDYNTVYNNYFNNTDVTVKKGSGNSYNITKTAGTNIIGGSYIGGNYWGKPDGKGFSDTAVDSDGDGIADSAYSLPGDSSYKDYLPLGYSSTSAAPTIPVADFSSSITSGNAPLEVLFTDKSTGTPTSWNWDFGDGTNSQDQNPIHTYTSAGNYNVTLKVNNANGETSKTDTITVLQNSEAPVADFGTNATQGSAPLAIQFTDLSQKAVSWNWDFGDSSSSTDQNPAHVYENPGDYTVNLTVSNENGTASKTLGIKVLEAEKEGFPVADFSTSATGGYAPLSVTFTDLSQNAASISWDVNSDGIEDSNASSFTYEYASAGTYTAKLTATNANGTSEKTTTIDVDDEDDGGSSHSSGSSGGGGGGGGSPEPAKNVEVKEISQVFVTNGKPIQFDFTKNAICVVYVGFDSRKTFGKTTTIAEQLKSKSTLTSNLTEGEVYKYFNVWVGNSGFASSENIENPVICFKVEKSWLQDNNIDQDSITLNRYSDETWEQMPASLLNEDSRYLYFTANVSGYSFFAITGKAVQQVDTESTQIAAEERSVGEIQSEGNDTQEPEPDDDNSEIILMGLIAIVALAVIGIVLKSVKK